MRTLTVNSGPAAGQSLDVERELLIGRENADLVIADPEVSRRHATLRPVDGGVVVEDLGSSNGTFVNGTRISGEVTLLETGSLKIGDSEMTIDIERYPASDIPIRSVIPDEAAVTRARPVVAVDDRTAARNVLHPASASPPPAARPPAAAPPPAAPPPAEPPQAPAGAAHGAQGKRGPWAFVPGLVAVVVAVAIAVFVIISTNSSGAKTRPVSQTIRTTLVSQSGSYALFAGIVSGQPGGAGAATIDQYFSGALKPHGPPVPVSAKVTIRFNDGTILGNLQATAAPQPDDSVRVVGRGTFAGGTGKYKGATGKFTFLGGPPKLQLPNARFQLTGSIKY